MVDWTQLTIAGAALLCLFYVVKWNSKQQEKRDERQAIHDELQGTRYEALINNYISVTEKVLDVVGQNTAALGLVEKGINGLPAFVRQVDERLRAGSDRFDSFGDRLDKLEGR